MHHWRQLTSDEIARLENYGNCAVNWNGVLIEDGFDLSKVRGCSFSGTVRLGAAPDNDCAELGYGSLRLPAGLSNSRIDSCTIAGNCAIHDVHYLSGYSVGPRCILFNIGSMTANGKISLPEVAVMNENGGRKLRAFPGMTCSDAFLMAGFPDDRVMLGRIEKFTEAPEAEIGEDSTICNVQEIDGLYCGADCHISSATRIANVAIMSCHEAPCSISGNAVMSGGCLGPGNRVSGGCIAENFATGENCSLSGGLRIFDTVLGDNSHVACCELVSNLIFPAHEQHHNNSFLIASCTGGQSNVAAGVTIGSNHNGRTADNEIHAGRGFWPGLCVSLKHSSRFASYTLIAKGSYPAELNLGLPFSLVSDNVSEGILEIMPAYYWLYNMYALFRNDVKYRRRDSRKLRSQNIEFGFLAPDTMQEVFTAIRQLEQWAAEYCAWTPGEPFPAEIILPPGILEKSRRNVKISKAARSRQAYREMIIHYYFSSLTALKDDYEPGANGSRAYEKWINVGGQPVRECELDALRADIRDSVLNSWDEIHGRWNSLWARYPTDCYLHAAAILNELEGSRPAMDLSETAKEEERIIRLIVSRVKESRAKDHVNPFRAANFRNSAEMEAVLGRPEDDSVIAEAQRQAERQLEAIKTVLERIK